MIPRKVFALPFPVLPFQMAACDRYAEEIVLAAKVNAAWRFAAL